MDHETDIQPKQTETKTQIRIPRPHEDGRGPQSHPTPQKSGSKSIGRLKKNFEFKSVVKGGDRFVGAFLCVDRKKGPSFKFGITTSRRFGNSPERNRFRRLVREAVRSSIQLLPKDMEIHILPRQMAKSAKMGDIQKELIKLLC